MAALTATVGETALGEHNAEVTLHAAEDTRPAAPRPAPVPASDEVASVHLAVTLAAADQRHEKKPNNIPGVIPPVWRRVAQCESGGNPRDTAGMFDGMYQFLPSTWLADGGGRYAQHAYDATRAEQLVIARVALKSGGPQQWPVCGPLAGLTVANGE